MNQHSTAVTRRSGSHSTGGRAAQQLVFDFSACLSAPRRGRPSSRYDQFVKLLREAVGAKQGIPSYGQLARAMGFEDRSRVRALVVYGEKRGDVRRGVGFPRIELVA